MPPQDLKNLESIGALVRRLDPDFDFSPVVREWAAEIPKELSFRCEADNMRRVERNLAYLTPAAGDDAAKVPERRRAGKEASLRGR